jgi:hypothetical protein
MGMRSKFSIFISSFPILSAYAEDHGALPVGLHHHRNISIQLTLFKTFAIIGKISEKRQINL